MAEPSNEEEIKEEEENPKSPLLPSPPQPTNLANPNPSSSPSKAFAFWAYFTISVSLLSFLLSSLHSHFKPNNNDQLSWFLSLPQDLLLHHSHGKLIKVQVSPSLPPIQVFVVEQGPRDAETVLFVPGLGCNSYSFRKMLPLLASRGVRAVAVDLPGSGFSDMMGVEGSGRWGGVFGGLWNVYSEIKEKGVFWAFDQLVETGQMPYEEIESKRESFPRSGLLEMGSVIAQVVDSMALVPIHLVVHDSALGPAVNYVSMNPSSVRSMTFLDSAAESAAFPSWILSVPVVGQMIVRSRSMFTGLMRLCCSRSMEDSAAEAYRLLLNGKDGRKSVVAAGKGLNFSFDMGEWMDSEEAKDMPLQILWSNSWSDRWIDEGRRSASAIPQAKFSYHSGGRWPQEDAAEEITERIVEFVTSLPKSVRQIESEPLPEHIKKMFEEADPDQHSHHGHGHGHDHGHEHAAGYMNMYGLGQGWMG